jgi:hypothetical protein
VADVTLRDLIVEPAWFWCDVHLAPYEATWPAGYMLATSWLLRKAMEREDIQHAAGGKVERLQAVLREYSPICCLLGDDLVAHATHVALHGTAEEQRQLVRG